MNYKKIFSSHDEIQLCIIFFRQILNDDESDDYGDECMLDQFKRNASK